MKSLLAPSILMSVGLLAGSSSGIVSGTDDGEAGLLFYLSGENGFVADYANGENEPVVIEDIRIIEDGAIGSGFECPHFTQLMAYRAEGNIYAQRGTLAFFWRARDPIGTTPFPIFQVSYSDHSSLDMVWLRIDFNGEGFDAFVTDASLARARVSYRTKDLPEADQWVHFALTWDETQGVRFYLDGALVGLQNVQSVFYAGLDKFGPHADVIGPQDIATMEQFLRGGDIDEIRVYDQMLSDRNLERLARGQKPEGVRPVVRDLSDPVYRQEWWLRYGWNRQQDPPPYLEAAATKVRKVEIHDVYDLKQWFWKGNDGIRETTWPGVYNRSNLPGRNDYFPRPDWNCYSLSGKSVTFTLPDEPWNHIEVAGSASGMFSYLGSDRQVQKHSEEFLITRPSGQERTYHRLDRQRVGGKIRFVNDVQEMPIGEFAVYRVQAGDVPQGIAQLSYKVTNAEPENPALAELVQYVEGRFMPDERTILVALPEGAPRTLRQSPPDHNALPLVHILIPFEFRIEPPGQYERWFSYTWENMHAGLDGIAVELPALDVQPTHGEFFPLNIQIKDPLWPDRNLLNFTFAVRPGEARTLWLDTRDRVLPNGYSLYLTLAGAGQGFGAAALEGMVIRLIFKDRDEAAVEHKIDRFTQVRDNVGNFLEWGTNKKQLKLYDRYSRDITDLLRVNPNHLRGRYYWSYLNHEQPWPPFTQPSPPEGVPLWAFRQVELVKLYRHFINWWIDERQIDNGEFGGGLSDDGDMTNLWPGAALMGIDPDKIEHSIKTLMDAFYENEMFTEGLNTILTDSLHTYEEGINVLPQVMLLDYGDPKTVERIMETARALERITGIDDLGHRHVRSIYFNGTQISEDPVWARAYTDHSHLIFQPGLSLVEYNGHPGMKKLILELADGLLAHRKQGKDGHYYLPREIAFPSGEELGVGLGSAVHLFWAAWRWTGDGKYLTPIRDAVQRGDFSVLRLLNANVIDFLQKRQAWGPTLSASISTGSRVQIWESYIRETPNFRFLSHLAWQLTGHKMHLEDYYAEQIQSASQRMSMFTEDHWWVDRVSFPSGELQRSRLGGVALLRGATYPGHMVSWKFVSPARAESVALLIPEATPKHLHIQGYNLEPHPVKATLTAWDIDPGVWTVRIGVDESGDGKSDRTVSETRLRLERTESLEFTFDPRTTMLIEMSLEVPGTPYWDRPDLGIGEGDIRVEGNQVIVTVHNLGAVDSPAVPIVVRNPSGIKVAEAIVPGMEAPLDLFPRTQEVTLTASGLENLTGCEVVIDPEGGILEITKRNNRVEISN